MADWQENYQLYKRYVKNLALLYQKRKDVRTYIELMLTISVIVIFGIFALRPTFVTIIELDRELKSKEETLDLLNTKIQDIDQAQKVWEQNRLAISLLDTAVPDGPLPSVYARQIEGLTKRHDSILYNLNFEPVSILGESTKKEQGNESVAFDAKDAYPSEASAVSLTFDVLGEYQNVKSFLSELMRLRRPIFIDSFSIRPDDDSQGQRVILTVVGRTPYLID